MIIEENIALAPRTTLGVGGAARWFTAIVEEDQIPPTIAWARRRHLPWMVLGGGSNLLVSDRGFAGLVLAMRIRGRRTSALGAGRVALEAGAGEDWDEMVGESVAQGHGGLECLSGIPGTVGATPVQNVGAYGQEVSDSIATLRAWDSKTEAWCELPSDACGFGYRTSRFNGVDAGRFVITTVRFHLRQGVPAALRYPELQRKLAGVTAPSLQQVREAVRELRRGKGMLLVPGAAESRSAGSFFKNPLILVAELPELARRAGAEPPQYPAGPGQVKVPAAWLIQRAGFAPGFRLPGSGAGISTRHVLALINYDGAACADLVALARAIQAGVEERLGVRLRPEPVPVGFESGDLL